MDKINVVYLNNGVLVNSKNQWHLECTGKRMELEKQSRVRYPRIIKTNMMPYRLMSDIRNNTKDNLPTVHNPRKARSQKEP